MMFTLTCIASGTGLGVWGYSILERCGPCTLHLGFGGLALMGLGGVVCVVGVVRLARDDDGADS
jgi:hypothetical protein